jgi:LAO/AO transport system kinase
MESELVNRILKGDVLAAARLIRDIENEETEAAGILADIYPHTGRAFIVGITGPPGSGKSTLLGGLIAFFRMDKEMTVGVVAVDPTSPLTGGAFLGDRMRIQRPEVDGGVFIRSLASRGWKGGLSKAAVDTVRVMDAMGKDIVFIETVGSGQGDVDIAGIADTCIAVLIPGMGDDFQMMKAGIMELADIFVINKADREGAGSLKTLLESVIDMKERSSGDWKPPVLLAEATTGEGMEQLGGVIIKHRDYLTSSGELEKRRKGRGSGV